MNKKEKVSKFQIWVTALGFLGLLFVPSVAWVFCHDTVGDDISENRKLAEMPKLGLEKIEAFPSEFENFWNDHVPFRSTIRKAWANLNFFWLRDLTTDKVISGKGVGRERWLFYTPDANENPVLEAQGIEGFNQTSQRNMSAAIKRNTEKMEQEKRELYYLILPNKENVYREKMGLTIYDSESRVEKFLKAINKTWGNKIIYPKNALIKNKKNEQEYFRQDTHWNDYGAFIGFKEIMKKIEPNYENFDYKISYTNVLEVEGVDLERLTGIEDYFEDTYPVVEYLSGANYEIQTIETDTGDQIDITTNVDAPLKKTVMLIGDSYRTAIKEYFFKVYEKCIFMHRDDFKRAMVEEYDPDIVISEFVERKAELMRKTNL